MEINRFGAALAILVTGALVLAGCDGRNNATGGSAAGPSSGKVSCGGKATLKASGSTAQANAMTRFIDAFERACPGQTLNYTANGSGAGIAEFNSNQTDFAGSDSALSPIEEFAARKRCGSPAWNLPVVFGPIAITYNVRGLNSLVLDGPAAAKIFGGAITTWDDSDLQALNPGVSLPAEPIRVVFRSDLSGTTDNFQKYLESASEGAWDRGAGKVFKGGVGEGARGNDGTSAAVKRTEGAITYNEWSFALGLNLNTAKIVTSAGPDPVVISDESVGKTIAGATIEGGANVEGDDHDLTVDTVSFYKPTEPGAYPIVLATYEIVCSKYPDPQVGTAVKAFLQSTIGAGQNGLEGDNGYIPIPGSFRPRLSAAVNAVA